MQYISFGALSIWGTVRPHRFYKEASVKAVGCESRVVLDFGRVEQEGATAASTQQYILAITLIAASDFPHELRPGPFCPAMHAMRFASSPGQSQLGSCGAAKRIF